MGLLLLSDFTVFSTEGLTAIHAGAFGLADWSFISKNSS